MTTRLSSGLAAALLAAALSGLIASPATASTAVDPAALPGVAAAKAEQVVVVTADSASTSYGTVRAYERRADGTWAQVLGATPARLGSTGLVDGERRRQGSGKTPAGTYGIEWAFGRATDPGSGLRYVRVDRDDAWTYHPDSPSTYNVFQDAAVPWRGFGSYVERLWSYGPQYDYVAVLDYNLPDGEVRRDARGVRRTTDAADTTRGGGIFLHVTNGKPTAGCIAVPREAMRQLLRWLDPKREPVIVIGTDRALGGVRR